MMSDKRTIVAKILDFLTGDNPDEPLPKDCQDDRFIPPIKLAIKDSEESEVVVPLAEVHPVKLAKLHAVLAKPKAKKRPASRKKR
jgi:hypothetical protein